MSGSMYHSATGVQAPHCMHVVGIGRTGAVYVEALLRTGEIEDLLADPRARHFRRWLWISAIRIWESCRIMPLLS